MLVEIIYKNNNINPAKLKTTMKDLNRKYETAKINSIEFMRSGQISNYFKALLEMNKYKRLMMAVIAN
jgi:hypothetical protein